MRIVEFKDPQRIQQEVTETLQYIFDNCSDFVADAKHSRNFLYRGFRGSEPKPIITGSSTNNRRPYGQSAIAQKVLDTIFTMAGYEAGRKNTICCTPDLSKAEAWGYSYFMFPVNGYKFTWSTEINDIGGDYDFERILQSFVTGSDLSYNPIVKITPEEAREFVGKYGFHKTNMSTALAVGNEINISGEYVAISTTLKSYVYNYFAVGSIHVQI